MSTLANRSLFVRQRGSVLMAALMILIVLTLLVLAATRGSALMERLVGNSRQLDQAFQTTETALRQGEAKVGQAVLPDIMKEVGWYHYSAKVAPDWSKPASWDDKTKERIKATGINAEYVIEELPAVPDAGGGLSPEPIGDASVYRITARGYGERGDTFVILQTTYRR